MIASPLQPLRGRTSFDRVFRTGRRVRVGPVTVVLSAGEAGVARGGIVTGRDLGGAVVRNRIRRRVREALRHVAAPPGVDFVVVAGAGAEDADFGALVGALRRALEEGMKEEDA